MKIAIASGKGGTGKTTLSVNLAAYLAQERPVVLTDLDVEEPNSGLFLHGQLEESREMHRMVPSWDSNTCTLCGLCQQVCNFNAVIKLGDRVMVFPELCHGCYACSELCPAGALPMVPVKMGEIRRYRIDGVSFIDSRLDIGQEQAVPLIARTLSYVDEWYPGDVCKIYDSPPGTSCPVIEAVKDADFVLLVTEPTPFGLNDLKLAVETVQGLNKRFAVVINRDGLGNADVRSWCETEKIEVIAGIPNRREIAEMYSRGELLYKTLPEVARELEKIDAFLQNLAEKERGQ
ncbi:ATP-binding protein [Marispirochaeta sp.]|jgi:MinD superfamily P-loop ATPase|uniref:ATP-binding protein n=1 Tax=Marispirochaeta sp. TaxID=2038653 RepID=UPI0029C6078A|nr:ATP-binding protein [Marispirochaeta sp.]